MKKLSISKWFILLSAVIFITSCDNNQNENESTTDDQEQTEQTGDDQPLEVISETESFNNDDIVYTWVDNLNIRAEPNTKGKVVTKVSDKQPLVFTGERSDKVETIVLRGVAYYEPWLKVRVDGKEGWVFGGAVKREGEEKGNDEITATKFNFEKFGQFDLSSWRKVSTDNTSGDERDMISTIYERGNDTLIIVESSIGELYYDYHYVWSKNGTTIVRDFSFGFSDPYDFVVTETISDFKKSKKYERKQVIGKPFSTLNAKPMMARGEWEAKELEATH